MLVNGSYTVRDMDLDRCFHNYSESWNKNISSVGSSLCLLG